MRRLPSDVQWVNLQTDSAKREQQETVCEKMLRNIKGIIFDFDGTLFDNTRIAFHMIAANPVAAVHTLKERLVRSRFAGRDFMTPENYYRAFFTEMGKACRLPPAHLRNWYFNHYMPRMIRVLKKHYSPRPGLNDLIQKTNLPDSKLKIAVYSDYPVLKERMEALGLTVPVNLPLYGPETFGAQKPAARPFLQIAKSFNLKPEEILVIGDREDTDGLGALYAGMKFFCLETGRKRYYRLDPYRRKRKDAPQGPTLLMYAGKWERLISLLLKRL